MHPPDPGALPREGEQHDVLSVRVDVEEVPTGQPKAKAMPKCLQ